MNKTNNNNNHNASQNAFEENIVQGIGFMEENGNSNNLEFISSSMQLLPGNETILPTTNEIVSGSEAFIHSVNKAKEIIEKFKQENESNMKDLLMINPDYAKNREMEKKKLNKALLKNFEYITTKDVQILQQQLLIHTEASNNSIIDSKIANSPLFKKAELYRKHGIGSNKNKRKHHDTTSTTINNNGMKRQLTSSASNNNSIYISGLNTKNKNELQLTNQIRGLFECFGAIERIKCYKENTKSKRLKGDALITLEESCDVTGICGQLHGAELCGHIISVQPAEFNKEKQTNNDEVNKVSMKEEKKKEVSDSQLEDPSDLDDFFSSLE